MTVYIPLIERVWRYPASSHLAQAVELAADGRVGEALKVWKFHKEQGDLCICGLNTFDQVRCGYCFTGKLLTLELECGPFVRDVDFLETARRVQDFVGAQGLEPGSDGLIPEAPTTGFRTS